MIVSGGFLWFDLLSGAPEDAKAFYAHVFGWGTQRFAGDTPYTLWTIEDGLPVGGLMELPADAGTPPHWLGYVFTADIASTEARVLELGGRVYRPTEAVPGVGRFAIVADPQGASFALLQPDPGGGELAPRQAIGNFSWAELNTTDWESAWAFYRQLFDWSESARMEMGDDGTYFMFRHPGADASMGGMSNAARALGTPAHWLYYTNVNDMEVALERVRERGGHVLNGPMVIHGDAAIAQCRDPQGALFALYAESR